MCCQTVCLPVLVQQTALYVLTISHFVSEALCFFVYVLCAVRACHFVAGRKSSLSCVSLKKLYVPQY